MFLKLLFKMQVKYADVVDKTVGLGQVGDTKRSCLPVCFLPVSQGGPSCVQEPQTACGPRKMPRN